MKKTLLLILTLSLFAADKPKKRTEPEAWTCRISSYHQCKCGMQVREAEEEINKKCDADNLSPIECVKAVDPCAIISKPDLKHAAHTCKRTCKEARCACHDGPPCDLPSLSHDGDFIYPEGN